MNPVFLMLLKLGASVVLRSAVKFSKTKVDDCVLAIIDEIIDLLKRYKRGEDIDLVKFKDSLMWQVSELQKAIEQHKVDKK